jgi:CheY-like chemotaxis protein
MNGSGLLPCKLTAKPHKMPGMTGADLQRRLIADGYRIPIIFLSANCSEEDRNRLLNDGALCV